MDFFKPSHFSFFKYLSAVFFILSISACNHDDEGEDSSSATSSESSSEFSSSSQASSSLPSQPSVTWHQDIAPLVIEKCSACHTSGGIAPFSVETYQTVKDRAGLMLSAIKAGRMPPWAAQSTDECDLPAAHKGDLRLTEDEKTLFETWVDDGAPEGDAAHPALLPEPITDDLQNPMRQITMPTPIEVPHGSDRFACFRIELGNEEKVWLTGSQIVPGNTSVAHHALIFTDPSNRSESLAGEDDTYNCFGGPGVPETSLVGVWAPGMGATVLPDNTGTPLQPNTVLVVQMHYHPSHGGSSAAVDDATRVDIAWTSQEPDYVTTTFLFGNVDRVDDEFWGGEGFGLTTGPDFLIPAGEQSHVEINKLRLPLPPEGLEDMPIRVWQAAAHMHYVGIDMKVTANEDTDREQCLVHTPKWDYRWQRLYYFDKPIDETPIMKLGDTLTLRCTYNNSMSNPYVVEALQEQGLDAPVDVRLGDETLDEMCIAALGLAVPAEYAEALGF